MKIAVPDSPDDSTSLTLIMNVLFGEVFGGGLELIGLGEAAFSSPLRLLKLTKTAMGIMTRKIKIRTDIIKNLTY